MHFGEQIDSLNALVWREVSLGESNPVSIVFLLCD